MLNVFSKLKEKDGFMSILIMLFVSCLLPLFLFSLVEMNYYYSMKDKAQWVNDHMASSAVRSLNQTELSTGVVEIDQTEAQERANRIFKSSYQLEDDLTIIPDTSFLRESPMLKVYVLNEDQVGKDFITDEGKTFKVQKPSVIVYSSIQPKGVFFNKLITLQSYSIYGIDYTSTSTPVPPPPPKITHITRSTYTLTPQNGGTLNGILIYEHVQETGADTYTLNYADGSTGTMTFSDQTNGRWNKVTSTGTTTTGTISFGYGITPTNLAGVSLHAVDGNKKTWKVTITLTNTQTITNIEPQPTPPPIVTISNIQFEKSY